MMARSRKVSASVLFFAVILFLTLGFLSLPSLGPGGGTALADPGTGWENQSANYFGVNRRAVAAAGADTAWVGGDYGSMIATSTGGSSWKPQYTGTTNPIVGISPVDATTAWAVSSKYGSSAFIKTTDGGATWTVLKSGAEAGEPEAVSAVDSSTVWIAGSEFGTLMNRMVWKTTDGGSTWVRKDTPSGMGLTGISAVDAYTAWAVGPSSGLGEANGVLFKTVDGGDNWVAQGTDVPHLMSVCAIDASNAWAAGSDGAVLKTTDGGANWVEVRTGAEPKPITSFSAVDGSVAYMVGRGGLILRTGDGGATWVAQGSASADLTAVYAVDRSVAWAVGAGGIILKTTNEGADWREMIDTTRGFMNDLNCVDAVDADTAWAGGDGVLVKTVDGGANWDVVYASGSTRIFDVCAVDKNNLWVVGIDGGTGFIYKTADGGAHWSLQYYRAGTAFTGISAVDATTAWAVGAGGVIVKTTDGGGSWAAQNSGTTMDLSAVCAVDAARAWASGWSIKYIPTFERPYPPYAFPVTYYPIILKTTDGGANWTANQVGTYNEGFEDIAAADANTAVAVGKDISYSLIPGIYTAVMPIYLYLQVAGYNCMLVTNDGGVSWSPRIVNMEVKFKGVDMADPENGWAVGDGAVVIKTHDAGLNWQVQDAGQHHFTDVDAVDPATAWVVGRAGAILKTVRGGDAWPDIVSLDPQGGGMGTEVKITGCDFGAARDSSYVSFAGVAAVDYKSWSDDEIVVSVPAGVGGPVKVTVTTPVGTSNAKTFAADFVETPPTVISVTPNQGMQGTIALDIALSGTDFRPGCAVRLEKGSVTSKAYNVKLTADMGITCTVGLFGLEPGSYDLVVENPDGQEARLPGAFTVTSACGAGSGTALLVLGLTLGLLSLAGSAGIGRRRRS